MWTVRLRKMSHGARYLPLDPLDFEHRGWVQDSGWPMTRSEMDPYYRRAHPVCGLGPYEHDPIAWEDENAEPLPLDANRVRTSIEHFGAGDVFSERFRDSLERSSNVRIIMHSNVLELRQDAEVPAVSYADIVCFGGNRFTIRAKVYVVANGALETARLLLLSDGTSPGGLGNENDLVGRYYMDHLWIDCGRLVPSEPTTDEPDGHV